MFMVLITCALFFLGYYQPMINWKNIIPGLTHLLPEKMIDSITTASLPQIDRMFLDEVATDILHLHSKKVDTYRGNYTEYFHTMTEKLKNQQREYESQMEYRKHIQEFIDKFRY